jgi:tetratricopeptide (TPR) repeat protein
MKFILSLSLLAACAACAGASNMFADMRDLARIAKSPKERMVLYTEAINAWENGDSERDLAALYYERGSGYLSDGDEKSALADFSKSISLDAKNRSALQSRGALYFKQGDYEKALADYSAAIELNSDDPDTYFNRAQAYARFGEFDLAATDYKKVISLRGEDANTLAAYGAALTGKAEYDDAMELFARALKLDPLCYAACINRAYAYVQTGDYLRAMTDYDKALSLESGKTPGYLGRGSLYVFTGDYDKAQADYDAAAKINDSDEMLAAVLGRLEYMRGEPDKASLRFEQIISSASRPEALAIAFRYQAMILKEQNDAAGLQKLVSAAQSYFMPLIARMPDNGAPYAEMSLVYSEAGAKPEDALGLAEKALDIKPDFTAYYAVGRAQLLNSEPKKALKALKKAVKQNPSATWAFYWLSKISAQRGDKDDARDYYAQVQKINPGFRFPLPVR